MAARPGGAHNIAEPAGAAGGAQALDHLGLTNNKKVLKALSSNSATRDTVLWSSKVAKINRKGKSQVRVLLITNRSILNLMPDNYSKCNRCIRVKQLHHVSTSSSTQEFVLHVAEEYDYKFKSPLYSEVVAMLQHAYERVVGDKLQVVDMDTDELARQVMTKVAVKQAGTPWNQGNKKGLASLGEDEVLENDEEDSEDEGFDKEPAAAAGGDIGRTASMAQGAFDQKKSRYAMDDFETLKVLGKGAFGKVMLVRMRESGKIFAMKQLSKQLLLERNEVVHTKTERKALEDTHHPFLVHLRFAFQTPTKLYLVMDYCNGGELFYHLKMSGRFPESRARLYASEICSALEHLHTRQIIYRDLKPENVLLDSEGHVRITDFGLAKDAMELNQKTHTFCGTPDYLAPEIIMNSGHGRGVDWWSLGTMIYEMLGGLPPYYSDNVNLMYERVLQAPLKFNPERCFNAEAQSLLMGMLQKQPELRLGSGERDALEIKEHPWFREIDWVALVKRELLPTFVPTVSNPLDTSNFDDEFTSQALHEPESMMPESALGGNKKGANAFDGFTYVDKSALG